MPSDVVLRRLTASELGIEGHITDFVAFFSVTGGTAYIRIDLIIGEIKNPFEVYSNFISLARASRADTLHIQTTVANERLYEILTRRYGMSTDRGKEVLVIPLE